jgi:hypothetical protein
MFFMGMPMSEGSKQLMEHWRVALSRFYDTPLKYSGFLAFLLGIYMIVRKKDWLPLAIFMLPFSAFIMVVLKAGITFIGNEYYMILMVPPMAFIAGCGLAQLNNQKLVTFALFVISVEGIANKIHDFRIRQPYASLEKLETIFDEVSHRTDLIAINGGAESGTAMFCAHRRGWRVSPELFTDNSYMEYLKNNGCKFILIIRKHPWVDLNLDLPKVFESEYFKIYKLQ